MLLRHLDDDGAQQQQRDEVRDGHEAVERVGDIPHERQVRDRAGHNDEAEDDLIGADDLAAKEELRPTARMTEPAFAPKTLEKPTTVVETPAAAALP